jgi:EF-P beta-lysylation protein EpmB
MIPLTPAYCQTTSQTVSWQRELARAITDPAELLGYLELPPHALSLPREAGRRFSLRVPRSYAARMRKRDPRDPLLLQVWPRTEEDMTVPGFSPDPVGDIAAMRASGLLHKYYGRVLLTLTGACAVHCRYCFRRHFPYADANPLRDSGREVLDYLAQDEAIAEVILSGGDPLMLNDRRLGELAASLAAIPHLRRLRLHTRLPVVIPQRVDDALLSWLTGGRLKPVVVLHINHANEIDDGLRAATRRLAESSVTLLNQAVLLRGVNDSSEALVALSEGLFAANVMPYYLHLLDKVQGAAHFDVPEEEAKHLLAEVQARLPGYLVPRLTREEPGGRAKRLIPTPLAPPEG